MLKEILLCLCKVDLFKLEVSQCGVIDCANKWVEWFYNVPCIGIGIVEDFWKNSIGVIGRWYNHYNCWYIMCYVSGWLSIYIFLVWKICWEILQLVGYVQAISLESMISGWLGNIEHEGGCKCQSAAWDG